MTSHVPEVFVTCEACCGEGSIEKWESVSLWSVDPPCAHVIPRPSLRQHRRLYLRGIMSNQQFADVLLAKWQELWPMPPAERIKRIDEIRQEHEYQEHLRRVEKEMAA